MEGEIELPLREHSMPISSDEVESHQHGNGPSGGNQNPSDLEKSESDRIKTFYKVVLSAIVAFILLALSSHKDMEPLYSTTTSHSKAQVNSLLVAEGLFLLMTFIGAVALMIAEIFVSQNPGRRCLAWYRVVTVLVAVTGMMLILANTVVVVVTNENSTVLAVVLAPVMILVGVFTCSGAWMEERPSSTPTPPGSRYDMVSSAASDMAYVGTIASFTLQGSVIFGYLKTPGGNGNQQGKHEPPLDLAACYATSTLSLIVMMVCAMPLRLLPGGMLEVLVVIVQKLRHAMLAALAMMALVVSVEFLDGFVVLSFFPEAIAMVLYYAVKFVSACQPREENSPHDSTFQMVTTGGFALMTGLYAAFVGIDHYNVYLKAAMFVLLLAVLSSLSRLAIPFHTPEIGGAVEMCIASVALVFPLVAFAVACPLVIMVFIDLYLHR